MTEIPSDIPSDVVALARKYSMNDDVLVAVCRAILAERERCAKIAETMPPTGFPACYWMLENRAAAIRNNS